MTKSTNTNASPLTARVASHLHSLYPDRSEPEHAELVDTVIAAFGITDTDQQPRRPEFSADEVVLITYGDTLSASGDSGSGADSDTPPLRTLAQFLDHELADVVSSVHILPFFPASSDGGFSVVDYRAVAPELGGWDDIAAVAGPDNGRQLMADLILNHGSAKSDWFKQFRAGEAPGRDYYMTAEPDSDLSDVVRPRTHPLLQAVDTPDGTRHVWCTFSFDQVDFDFTNPAVLIEFCRIIDLYVSQGVTRLRLDAVAYVWKQSGTTSIHLDQTHELVKLMHTLLSVRAPEVLLITETNVPHEENVSYFGQSDEAHVVYNFSLVPLVLHAMLSGDAAALTKWAIETPPIPDGSAYLNFLASHDGMGVRPAEGLLSEAQIGELVESARTAGGTFSPYATPDGERPYELNVSLADILGRRDLSLRERYLCAHAIMFAFAGIPAIYIHSLLATPGDIAAVRTTGIKRNINRSKLDYGELQTILSDDADMRTVTMRAMCDLIRVRRRQPAFAPDAAQAALDLGPSCFGLRRTASDASQTIWALHNVTSEPHELSAESLDGYGGQGLIDLLTGEQIPPGAESIAFRRWQPRWLA